ncbi:MAG: glutathione S-transferase family protein [Parvularculales bacterium]
MRTLHHGILCPFSRKVRLLLAEKAIPFQLVEEPPGSCSEKLLSLNPAGETPVLIEAGGRIIAGHRAIEEYLEEVYPEVSLLPETIEDRAETRRLVSLFDGRINDEVTRIFVYQKITRRFIPAREGGGSPDTAYLKAGQHQLSLHLAYINHLAEQRNWLAGDKMSRADLAAAAHFSCLDYLGDVAWENHPDLKSWYVRLKSRPSFRALLKDRIAGTLPPDNYTNLDF